MHKTSTNQVQKVDLEVWAGQALVRLCKVRAVLSRIEAMIAEMVSLSVRPSLSATARVCLYMATRVYAIPQNSAVLASVSPEIALLNFEKAPISSKRGVEEAPASRDCCWIQTRRQVRPCQSRVDCDPQDVNKEQLLDLIPAGQARLRVV